MSEIDYTYDWPGDEPSINTAWRLFPSLPGRQPRGRVTRTEMGGEGFYVTARFDAAHVDLYLRAHPELGIGEL